MESVNFTTPSKKSPPPAGKGEAALIIIHASGAGPPVWASNKKAGDTVKRCIADAVRWWDWPHDRIMRALPAIMSGDVDRLGA